MKFIDGNTTPKIRQTAAPGELTAGAMLSFRL